LSNEKFLGGDFQQICQMIALTNFPPLLKRNMQKKRNPERGVFETLLFCLDTCERHDNRVKKQTDPRAHKTARASFRNAAAYGPQTKTSRSRSTVCSLGKVRQGSF
jgi:hypothetical protein